jgi:hypothetical protein
MTSESGEPSIGMESFDRLVRVEVFSNQLRSSYRTNSYNAVGKVSMTKLLGE